MIINLAHKLLTKYENLPPKPKAFVDIAGILLGMCIAIGIVGLFAYYGTLFQFFIGLICYLVWSAIYMLYKSRVQYYEAIERYKQ